MEIQGLFEDSRFTKALIVVSALTTILLVLNIFVIGGDRFFNIYNTLVAPAAALVTSFLFFEASRNKQDTASHYLWARMAMGFGLWGLADLTWAFYSIVLKITVPYPSIADLFWVVGYLPLYSALIKWVRSLKVRPNKQQLRLIVSLNGAGFFLVAIFIIIPMLQDFDASRLLEGICNVIYPLGDLGLVFLLNLIIVLLHEGRYSLVWRLIFSGMIIMCVSDLFFSFASWQGLYYPDDRVNALSDFVDTTYVLAYFFTGLGIYIYSLIWKIHKSFQITTETMPRERYAAFIATDRDNQIVTASDNFYCLVNDKPDTNYHKQRLVEVLGIAPEVFDALIDRVEREELVCNEPIKFQTRDHKTREGWFSAIAIFNPGREFAGANIAINAEIAVPADLSFPKHPQILSMLNYVRTKAGSRPQDEIGTMQVYFTEVNRLFASMLYQFGGDKFRSALFDELELIIQKENIPMKIDSQTIVFPKVQEGRYCSLYLLPLLKTGMAFTTNLVGEKIVNDDLQSYERSLSETVLRDLDKYHLREFHQVASRPAVLAAKPA